MYVVPSQQSSMADTVFTSHCSILQSYYPSRLWWIVLDTLFTDCQRATTVDCHAV